MEFQWFKLNLPLLYTETLLYIETWVNIHERILNSSPWLWDPHMFWPLKRWFSQVLLPQLSLIVIGTYRILWGGFLRIPGLLKLLLLHVVQEFPVADKSQYQGNIPTKRFSGFSVEIPEFCELAVWTLWKFLTKELSTCKLSSGFEEVVISNGKHCQEQRTWN